MEIPNKMYVAKTPYGVGRVTRPLHFISVLCKIFARSSGEYRIRSYENRERRNFSAFYPQHTDNPKSSRLIPYKNFSCRKKAEQNQFQIPNSELFLFRSGWVTRPLHFISILCKIFARSSGGCRIRPYENRERCNFSAFYPQHTDNPKSSRLIPYKNIFPVVKKRSKINSELN